MAIRYVSYDIREKNDYTKIYDFIKKNKGTMITKSLYRFETSVEWDTFVKELRDAVAGDDSVYIVFLAQDNKLAHKQVAAK